MWKCTGCQEKIEDSFDVCWNCGTSHDGVTDPNFSSEATKPKRDSNTAPRSGLQCPKCQSNHIIPTAKIMDQDGQYGSSRLKVRLDRNPSALIFKDAERVELRVQVCGECGFVELYASQPNTLWKAYKSQLKNH